MIVPPPSYNWKYAVGFSIGLIMAFIIMIIIANTVPVSQPPPPPPVVIQTPPTPVTPAVSGYA